mmetsp:Transcript_73972/g.178941  ORF Transcript_73972/g.178941 Transcript_73972/m.178941 type:complete len:97 (+) Transcript_73972:55-345(+)
MATIELEGTVACPVDQRPLDRLELTGYGDRATDSTYAPTRAQHMHVRGASPKRHSKVFNYRRTGLLPLARLALLDHCACLDDPLVTSSLRSGRWPI